MDVQNRKRYNRIILVSYIIGFILYGLLVSIALYIFEVGLFQMFPIWLVLPISFVVLGFGGGWFIAGLVGGVLLGYRFIRKQDKNFIILACVFAPMTLTICMWIGLILAVPLAIRNIIVIKNQ